MRVEHIPVLLTVNTSIFNGHGSHNFHPPFDCMRSNCDLLEEIHEYYSFTGHCRPQFDKYQLPY